MIAEKAANALKERAWRLHSANIAEAGSFCEVCRCPVNVEYKVCSTCLKNQRLAASGKVKLADSVGFTVYGMQKGASKRDKTCKELYTYKEAFGNDEAWWTVASLLAQAFHDDLPNLEARVGAIDLVTQVPSTKSKHSRALQNAVGNALEYGGRDIPHYDDLLESTGVSGSNRSLDNGEPRFRATEKAVQKFAGKHVLLIEDTWVTGSTVQEAAGVLKEAGAARVTVLCVARLLKPGFNDLHGFPEKFFDLPAPSTEHPVLWSGAESRGRKPDAPEQSRAQQEKIAQVSGSPSAVPSKSAPTAPTMVASAGAPDVAAHEGAPGAPDKVTRKLEEDPGVPAAAAPSPTPVTAQTAADKLPGAALVAMKYGDGSTRKGIIGEQRTAGILSVFLNNAHARVLHSVPAAVLNSSGTGVRDIDHVLFTTAGVFVINTKFRSAGFVKIKDGELREWVATITRDTQEIADLASTMLTDSAVDPETVYHPMVVLWDETQSSAGARECDGVTILRGENLADHIRFLPDVISPETCTAMFELVRLRLDK